MRPGPSAGICACLISSMSVETHLYKMCSILVIWKGAGVIARANCVNHTCGEMSPRYHRLHVTVAYQAQTQLPIPRYHHQCTLPLHTQAARALQHYQCIHALLDCCYG